MQSPAKRIKLESGQAVDNLIISLLRVPPPHILKGQSAFLKRSSFDRTWPFSYDTLRSTSTSPITATISESHLAGDWNWIWESGKDELRKVISKLKLLQLEVPVLSDSHAAFECEGYRGVSGVDVGDAIQRLLRAQPFLEEFKFFNSDLTSRSAASLPACLQSSDVPSLKSLQATPEVTLAFLPVAARLESLNMMLADWDDRLFE
ncbi:hypothetical protein M407DRAFT_16679 [Tulasnella calospora MUT 4182]|uniref:Uncharacterized protein n=1 Tax=Tulasnella calospora MUT 4182 TaxID=1051891 RepID=A0A0C3MM11_9AGAM|nr:hypothetical protein M407DRAFT_16679 [Tulasnella calospora MUT 4182]